MRYDDPLYDQHAEARDAYRHGANTYGNDRPTLAELQQEDDEADYMAGAVCPGCGDRYPSTSEFVDHVDTCGDGEDPVGDVWSWPLAAAVFVLASAVMFHQELARLFGGA